MLVDQKARVLCTNVSDRTLSNNLLHTHVKGSNFTLLDVYIIDVVRDSSLGV